MTLLTYIYDAYYSVQLPEEAWTKVSNLSCDLSQLPDKPLELDVLADEAAVKLCRHVSPFEAIGHRPLHLTATPLANSPSILTTNNGGPTYILSTESLGTSYVWGRSRTMFCLW